MIVAGATKGRKKALSPTPVAALFGNTQNHLYTRKVEQANPNALARQNRIDAAVAPP